MAVELPRETELLESLLECEIISPFVKVRVEFTVTSAFNVTRALFTVKLSTVNPLPALIVCALDPLNNIVLFEPV